MAFSIWKFFMKLYRLQIKIPKRKMILESVFRHFNCVSTILIVSKNGKCMKTEFGGKQGLLK